MIAWLATYADSGVETFICGENGVVYQKDLGPNTAALGASMAQYNPDASWKVVGLEVFYRRAKTAGLASARFHQIESRSS